MAPLGSAGGAHTDGWSWLQSHTALGSNGASRGGATSVKHDSDDFSDHGGGGAGSRSDTSGAVT